MYELPGAWVDAIEGCLDHLAAGGVSANTLRLRRSTVRSMARRVSAPAPSSVTAKQLDADLGRRQLSNDTRRSIRTGLTLFYAWAVDTGVVDVNPALKLPRVSESMPRPRPATDGVWVALLAAAPPRERLMARLACEAGLRRGEVAQVHTEDLISGVDGSSLIVHGKGGKQRVVPIPDGLADEIAGPPGYLFPRIDRWGNVADAPMSADRVGHVISALIPPGWSMHKLRHRFATRGYAGTGNLRAVQEALGHSSVATTQRYTLCRAERFVPCPMPPLGASYPRYGLVRSTHASFRTPNLSPRTT
jgi:integrase